MIYIIYMYNEFIGKLTKKLKIFVTPVLKARESKGADQDNLSIVKVQC